MATRSNIGILNQDGTVDYIYCHWDGYIENNGNILQQHYASEEKVRQLISLGDLSYLGSEIGEKQDFNNATNRDWCMFYGRDRGESNTQARKCSYADYTKEHFEEYVYLFTPGTGWQVRPYGVYDWTDLRQAIEEDRKINSSL